MTDQSAAAWEFTEVFADVLSTVPDEHFDRGQFVGGVGPLTAEIMLVGESPGGREVAEGAPFVGPAGQQLDRTLEAIGSDRGDVYITNLVKVRPPEDRDPHVDEIDAWWPVLAAELERVDPEVLVPLGSFAARAILETDETITELHGRTIERNGRVVVPSFHPAAALYDRDKVDALETDLATAFAATADRHGD